MRALSSRSARLAALALCLVLGVAALVLNAWQCDDAYITFRVVRNALEGHGLTWNPGERVQVYTHPLFLGLSLVVQAISGEPYYATAALTVGLGLGVFAAIVAFARERPFLGTATVMVLIGSRAFVEYAVSGLENPLLDLLLVAFVASTFAPVGAVRTRRVSWVFALAFLTRPDAVVLLLPAYLHAVGRELRDVRSLTIGLAPAWAWTLFSLVYYGSPVPNTAIAKLNVALPLATRLGSGIDYLRDSWTNDPITLGATFVAVVLALVRGDARARMLAAGALAYLGYVVSIGGDFMSGRFLGAPLVLALSAVLASERTRARGEEVAALVFVAASAHLVLVPTSPLHAGLDDGTDRPMADYVARSGIADERSVYYPYTGLLPILVHHADALARDELPMPPFPTSIFGMQLARSSVRAGVYGQVGFLGYHARDKVVIDVWALCDPLLARIPYVPDRYHRIGHYPRRLPQGYLESRRADRNLLVDPGLHAAYDDVRRVVSGPLFSGARLSAIVRLATGAHRAAFERAKGPAGIASMGTTGR